MSGRLIVVVGGQFGSEGKGAAAGRLAAGLAEPLVIRTGGPNAGHTVADQIGQTYKLRQLPTSVVTNPQARVAISARSLVDLEVLEKEMIDTGHDVFVDSAATILEPQHIEAELENSQLAGWSTQKGIGAARASRVMRRAINWGESVRRVGTNSALSADVAAMARHELRRGGTVLVEAAQGYGLGLHTGFYPKTTSADCRAIDALADVGLSPWEFGIEPEVWLVVRPYPIRVAGDSGPLKDETSWEELDLPVERTTVTDKVRRVGLWDSELVRDAIAANGGSRCKIWFSMADQVIPELSGFTHFSQLVSLPQKALNEVDAWLALIADCGAPVWGLGTGPGTSIVLKGGKGPIS